MPERSAQAGGAVVRPGLVYGGPPGGLFRQLLVEVRDPATYWKDYDPGLGVSDAPELVWYDEDWYEESSLPLESAAGDFPDNFMLSPDQKTLLAIRHPVDKTGKPVAEGHSLCLIQLYDGSVEDVLLPDADEHGLLPPAWMPVRMAWNDRGNLLVQAGPQLRIYEVTWE